MAAPADVTVGIDVAKARLDVAVQPTGTTSTVPRARGGRRRWQGQHEALWPTRLVLEASGGYERAVVAALSAVGLPVVVVNPRDSRLRPRPRAAWRRSTAQRAPASSCATGDIRHGRRFTVPDQPPVPPMETLLRPVGHRHRPAGWAGPPLPARRHVAGGGRATRPPPAPAAHARCRSRDRPPPLAGAADGLARCEAQVGHQLRRAAAARDLTEFGQHGHRRHGVNPAEAAQQTHRLAVVVTGRPRGGLLLQRVESLFHALQRAQIVVEGVLAPRDGQNAASGASGDARASSAGRRRRCPAAATASRGGGVPAGGRPPRPRVPGRGRAPPLGRVSADAPP